MLDMKSDLLRHEAGSSHRSRRSFHRSWLVRAGIVALCGLYSSSPVHAEYRLQPGDIIEVSVAGAPELRQRVPVELDGSISFPLIGSVHVAGLQPSEMRVKIQSALASKVFRTRGPDGREQPRTVERDEVAATVVEYRPIYVAGDVMRPGQQTYRPQMTVRQAIALSGGFNFMRPREPGQTINTSALQGEYTTTWLNLLKERVRIWRIRTELGEDVSFSPNDMPPAPVARSVVTQVVSTEAEYQRARQVDHDREKAFLAQAVKQSDEQIAILTEQQEKEEEGIQADMQELQRATELYGKGSLISQRVTDARRAVLLSATRKLQSSAQLMLVKRQRSDFQRQLDKLDEQRRLNLLRELQEASVNSSSLSAKLRGIDETLRSANAAPPRVLEFGDQPSVVVIRKEGDNVTRLKGEYDFVLEPGDTVEIALQTAPQDPPVQ